MLTPLIIKINLKRLELIIMYKILNHNFLLRPPTNRKILRKRRVQKV